VVVVLDGVGTPVAALRPDHGQAWLCPRRATRVLVAVGAEAALREATAAMGAGRRTPASASADLDRTVLPPIRDARRRAAALIGAAASVEDREAAAGWANELVLEEASWRRRIAAVAASGARSPE
jgi:hypothetical protein